MQVLPLYDADQPQRASAPVERVRADLSPAIAVLLPCFNEEAAIADVVRAFQAVLPAARVYAFDNRSTDDTAGVAAAAGAIVRTEMRPGKGNVVRRKFAHVVADIYVLAVGVGPYEPPTPPRTLGRHHGPHYPHPTSTLAPTP